jgi:uncharacterized protein
LDGLIDKLLELQTQHTHLLQLQERARSTRVGIVAKERQLRDAEATLANVHEERKAAQVEADAKELDIKTIQGKVEKYRQQLNEVKTNREYKAIQNEVKFAGIELRRLEDLELAAMDRLETISGKISGTEESLKHVQKELDGVKAKADAEVDALEDDIRKAERDRKLIAEQLPREALDIFDRVASKHEDGAMAPIISDAERAGTYTCGGCYMQLTVNDYVKLRSDRDTVLTCPSCARILYAEAE